MKIRLILPAILLGGVLLPTRALGFVSPISFSPAAPTAGQPISATFTAGACHVFAGLSSNTSINGNVVSVVIEGTQYPDPVFCNFPIYTFTYDIGMLPPGSYTVTLQIREIDPPFMVHPPAQSAALTVVAGAVAPIPSVNNLGLLLLFATILAISIVRARRHAIPDAGAD